MILFQRLGKKKDLALGAGIASFLFFIGIFMLYAIVGTGTTLAHLGQ